MRKHLVIGAAALALSLSACAGGNFRPVSDTPVRIGAAYAIRGTTYVPAAAPTYDAVGYASWYGSESGNRTANGEEFRPGWITAAHTTLPLPTYVEVDRARHRAADHRAVCSPSEHSPIFWLRSIFFRLDSIELQDFLLEAKVNYR